MFVESWTFKCEGERSDNMLNYEQVFGNVFERGESMLCSIDKKLLQSEQITTLQVAQQLKTNNINVVPGLLFSRQCKAKVLLETDSLY